MSIIEIEKKHSFAHVILNRPEKKNALTKEMMTTLAKHFNDLNHDSQIKAIIIKGAGDTFCAGADLEWMQSQIENSLEQNLKESEELFDLFWSIKSCVKPVISYVHKYAMGGALGLVAASDYCFAEENTTFCFSETRLGLAPSVISSFILSKCNIGMATPLMLFAEAFNAHKAKEIGLVHQVAPSQDLLEAFNKFIKHLEKLDLDAVIETKKLIQSQLWMDETDFKTKTTALISNLRIQDSAQSRLKEFFKKG